MKIMSSITMFVTLLVISQTLFVFAVEDSYDYIVVGAGTAGSIVATRLATIGTVLVLDAGDEPPEESQKVKGLSPLYNNPEYDWLYKTEKQTTLGEREIPISAGKVLGGTGSINSMIFLRGNKQDYNKWENEEGATGWGWDANLNLIKDIEDSHLTKGDPDFHKTGGPISIEDDGVGNKVCESFINAVTSKGYAETDPNNGEQTGAAYTPINFYNNERQSTYRKYLKPYLNHDTHGVTLVKKATVEKIEFEGGDDGVKKAVGVIYSTEGSEKTTVRANKEIIISAGTIGSPKLLMLSGIGPKEHLDELKIEVISNRPVGQNLQDNYAVYAPVLISFTVFDGKESAVSFVKTQGPEAQTQPDIEIEMFLFQNYSLTTTVLLHPKSRGTVKLRSTDPKDPPVIDPKYLSEEDDVNTLAKGLKIADEIVKDWQEPEGYIKNPDPYAAVQEACQHYEAKSHDYWKCVAKYMGGSIFHPVGTCRMGNKESATSVVDERLNVIGVKGLRVADASIMPTIVSANPQVTVMFIGEKASQMIISDNRSDRQPSSE